VYLHRKKTTGEVFYVGKGRGNRAWSVHGRNTVWKNVVKKHDYVVEIVMGDLQEWYAFELEKDLIALHGRRDEGRGTLVNLTDGGEGPSGLDCPTTDTTIYNFYNFKTKDIYRGLRVHFRNKYGIDPAPLFQRKSNRVDINLAGWVLFGDEVPTKLRIGFKGHLGPTADKQVYTFFNGKTGETFSGTRIEFGEKYNLDYTNMFSTGKSNRGWFCLEKSNPIDVQYCIEGNRPNPNRDTAIYNFKHIDGDTFTGMRTEFTAKFGLNTAPLFWRDASLQMMGWYLAEREEELLDSNNDLVEYTFYNVKTKETIKTTRRKFQDTHRDVAIHHVLLGKCTTIKGWTVLEIANEEELRKSAEGRKGNNSHMSCKIIYEFINVNTFESFKGTRSDFKLQKGIVVGDLFRKKAKVCKGWTLKEIFDTVPLSALLNKKVDPTVHVFVNNETGERFEGIRYDFRKKYGINIDVLFQGENPPKVTKGWSILLQ
jgi:hypothetical protein